MIFLNGCQIKFSKVGCGEHLSYVDVTNLNFDDLIEYICRLCLV